ncbi:hypothetical protein CH063_10947 [Colletotrichum higginsianum]|uniref:Uncharacterized protein n=1 Tax=Colletotrichum higginsianum (strain IMI 349063) TaxID=759273 RepID=H1VJF9_COLHI|nr:hypothetical protein CH063_10947 [Colletotrichum higginsianum]
MRHEHAARCRVVWNRSGPLYPPQSFSGDDEIPTITTDHASLSLYLYPSISLPDAADVVLRRQGSRSSNELVCSLAAKSKTPERRLTFQGRTPVFTRPFGLRYAARAAA